MTKCIWARATTIYYCPLPPPACRLLSQGARKESQSCSDFLFLVPLTSAGGGAQLHISLRRSPIDGKVTEDFPQVGTLALPPLVRAGEKSTNLVHFSHLAKFLAESYLKTGPDISITVSQECKKKKKNQENTLAGDREGNLRFWHSGNEHS